MGGKGRDSMPAKDNRPGGRAFVSALFSGIFRPIHLTSPSAAAPPKLRIDSRPSPPFLRRMTGTKTLAMALALTATLTGRSGAIGLAPIPRPQSRRHVTEPIRTTWPPGGLRQIWKHPLTDGFSQITVGRGQAVTLVTREVGGASQEVCLALDANTGSELWAVPLSVASYDEGGSPGRRTTTAATGRAPRRRSTAARSMPTRRG